MLYENTDMRLEGQIIVRRRIASGVPPDAEDRCRVQGFDEYMNVVLDDAIEISQKTKVRKALGRILLKGDNITLIMSS